MSNTPVLYLAGMGLVTSVGGNTAMTAASVKAGTSGYSVSSFHGKRREPVTMSLLPDEFFDTVEAKIDEGERFNWQHDRIVKMAIVAAHEACAGIKNVGDIPLLLAMTDVQRDLTGLPSLAQSLADNCEPLSRLGNYREFCSGRSAGIEAIDAAFGYARTGISEFVCVGGSDSYRDDINLNSLDANNRLLSTSNPDGFAPGEGAGFLLLTTNASRAVRRNGQVIALHTPGIAEEVGNLRSGDDVSYRGDGLDRAFKLALANYGGFDINYIYSSMNGESYWAKEFGVAQIRNKQSFSERLTIQHPADCYGDLGAATSPVLIALAADRLWGEREARAALVYCSSDSAKRGAVVVAKSDSRVNR